MRFVEVDEGVFVNLDAVEFVALKTALSSVRDTRNR